MKKKIFTLAALAICATMLASGTLAYFTVKDKAHNVITSSKVGIELIEKTKDKNGAEVDFPKEGISGVVPGDSVSKIVSVKNNGEATAWIRVWVNTAISEPGDPISNPTIKNLPLTINVDGKEIPELEVHLLKAIPFGAGLGGGSADAAFMLKLVNDYAKLGLSLDELETIAASIGADCPFFIQNKPVFATGTGNIFEPVELSLDSYYLCLVKPDVTVSTPEAYSMVTPKYPDVSLKEIIKNVM